MLRTRKDKEGAENVQDLLLDQEYWISVGETCQLFDSLIKVLRMIDSDNNDNKAEIDFLYEVIDQAKEQIKKNISVKYNKNSGI